MIFKIIASFFLLLCIVGILSTYSKMNKKYKQYSADAVLRSSMENIIFEKYIGLVNILFVSAILGTLLLSVVYEAYNERLLLTLMIGSLVIYYMNHYLPRSNWVIIAEGIISFGNSRCIKWGDINSYRWLKKNNDDMLSIQYKGSGLMTQRADFIISDEQIKQVKEVLSEKVINQQF